MTRIIFSEEEEAPLARLLHTSFEAFNAPFVGSDGYKPMRMIVFREDEDTPCGGILSHCYAAWLHVVMVYLPEDLRGIGIGSLLFDRLEEEAKARDCVGAYLDTLSWQARGFYEKRGYKLFATLPDSPQPHSRYFLSKRFDKGKTHVPT